MSTFELLSDKIGKKIYDMRWEAFTPIQDMAIPAIIETKDDIVLSSGTASGKTEAAFLPILSLVENTASKKLKVVYVSPLKALINNQFERIESLCEYTHIQIHRWHGDISQSKKKKILKNPNGILQITPESIESFYINRTAQLRTIFAYVDFIVIDEIHSFLDSERGVQLRSLLSRIEKYTLNRPRIIGLSATIDNFEFIKSWINPNHPENVNIIQSPGSDKNVLYSLMHFQKEKNKKPLELYEDMRELTRHDKALIFCNSRSGVEETTVLMNRLAQREGIGETYLPHHSSIDKKEREYVEKTMSESKEPKSIISTSSLELGIDVGSIDIVIQVDSTFSVSALKQRLGRSGRKQNANQILQLYSTEEPSLLQSTAVMELIRDKWIEPAEGYPMPYDILFHQILSISKEKNGLKEEPLINEIKGNAIFHTMKISGIKELIGFMLENEHLEKIRGSQELIVGLEGERLLRGKDFYAVFMTSEEFEVIASTKHIGSVDRNLFINVGDNIILAGKLWTIKDVDTERNRIYVSKTEDGKPPIYAGGGRKLHKKVAEKMQEILCSDDEFHYMNTEAKLYLNDMRRPYRYHNIQPNERVIWREKDRLRFDTFTGSVITQTLVWMLKSFDLKLKMPNGLGQIELPSNTDILSLLEIIKNNAWTEQEILDVTNKHEMFTSKFTPFLPDSFKEKLHLTHEVNIEEVIKYLSDYQFKLIELE